MMKPAPMQPICHFLFAGGAGIGSRSRSIELTVIVGAPLPSSEEVPATVPSQVGRAQRARGSEIRGADIFR